MLFYGREIPVIYSCGVSGACGQVERLRNPEEHLVEPPSSAEPGLRTPAPDDALCFFSDPVGEP